MRKNKKAQIDHFIELVAVIILLTIIILIVWSESKDKQKVIEEQVRSIRQKSYANNILVQYLDYSIVPCLLTRSDDAAKQLLEMGNLTFADLINLILEGEPKNSLYSINFRSKLYSQGRAEYIDSEFKEGYPYGQYASIWDSCTIKYFHDFDYRYDVVIYFNHGRNSISNAYVDLGEQRTLIGQATIPNFSNRKDIIQINIYETI